MLTREQSKNKSSVTVQKEKLGGNQRLHALEDKAQLTLNLLSVDGDPNMEEDVEENKDEFNDAMDRDRDGTSKISYLVKLG